MKTFNQFISEAGQNNISPELMNRMKKVWGGEKPNSDDPYWYKIPGLKPMETNGKNEIK